MSYEESSIPTLIEQELVIVFTLEADGKKIELIPGDIEHIRLDLHSYGFDYNVIFTGVGNADLNTFFNSTKITKATLTFKSPDPLKAAGPPFLELKGIVVRKSLKRVDTIDDESEDMIYQYEIVVIDNAQQTWGEHYPINVYVDQSMKDVLDAHKGSEISIKYDFPPLEEKHPITAFSLPFNPHLPLSEQISFYSFMTWYLYQEGGIWSYDYTTNTYAIVGKKDAGKGEPYKIREEWVMPPACIFPVPPRFNNKTLKLSPESLDCEDKEHPDAFKTVRRESVCLDSYRIFPEYDYGTIVSPLEAQQIELGMDVIALRDDFHIDKLIPGCMVSFANHALESWGKDPLYKGKIFRVRTLDLDAQKIGVSEKIKKPTQPFLLRIKVVLELQDEPYIERPFFKAPEFPFHTPGTIFSDIGDEPQSTYKISEGEEAPQGQYLVLVPLAGKDKKVVVPFIPDQRSGQFYFPLCKGEKVDLLMHFKTAEIDRILDWQPRARFPSGDQACQIMWGSNGDKYAFMSHVFEDGSDSIVTIQQATSATQIQTIEIKDKDITVTVVDGEDQKTMLLRLNTDEGVFLSLENTSTGVIQQLSLDGSEMTLMCKDNDNASTYVQKPDSVTVTAKTISMSCDNFIVDAKDSINLSGEASVDVKTPITNLKAGTVKMGE